MGELVSILSRGACLRCAVYLALFLIFSTNALFNVQILCSMPCLSIHRSVRTVSV